MLRFEAENIPWIFLMLGGALSDFENPRLIRTFWYQTPKMYILSEVTRIMTVSVQEQNQLTYRSFFG